jgi:thiol-disulfide isomerase/thioredoxin
MKKILPIMVIGILVLSGLGASAVNIEENSNEKNVIESSDRATHTVLGEDGTATWCGYCKYAHGALKELYAEGQLDFYYVTLVDDMNPKARARIRTDYNLYGFPTLWWDGGRRVNVGAGSIPSAKSSYTSSINYCGSHSVKNVDINLKATWQGGTSLSVECEVKNNEANTYDGTIRVYIVEKESSMGWLDTAGDPYTMAFLDWAFNEAISIPGAGSWSDTMTWNGVVNGFPSVTQENTMVIAAVFNDEWHQGYSYPPSSNPFDAYYVDDVVGVNLKSKTTNDLQEILSNGFISSLFLRFLENHPNMFPLIQKLLQ